MISDQTVENVPKRPGFFVRVLRRIWRALDVFRRMVHLLIMLMVFAIIVAMFSRSAPTIPHSAALILAPSGQLVEQLSGDPWQQALDELADTPQAETSIRDLVDALRTATNDARIKVVFLDLSKMSGAGLSMLQRLGSEIDSFRDSGRKVIVYGDFFEQTQYYLAAHADEVYLHPSGAVFLQGFGSYRMYMREAMEKLKVDTNVFSVGEYKSFYDPYTRDDMSSEDRAATQELLNALWAAYRQDVRMARGLDDNAIESYVAEFVQRLQGTGGDMAKLALAAGLVDELLPRDQVRERLVALTGQSDDSEGYRQVSFQNYIAPQRAARRIIPADDAVAVIVASGDVLNGEQPAGTIGGDSLAAMLRKARTDERVKAVVLRIDSPGGSTFASDIIHREVQLLRQAAKPIIASMGNVAASAGYFIAMDADEIWAAPTTITGSIGVVAHIPTFQNTLDAIGVHVDGVGTTQFSGDFRLDRELGEPATQVMQLSIEHAYRHFITNVARARNLSVERVDEIARGRVWIGTTAHDLGLVDRLGHLEDAIASAASHAGLGDDYSVHYVDKELTFREMLAYQLAGHAQTLSGAPLHRRVMDSFLASMGDQIARLARFDDPQNLYYHCFCELR